MAKPRLKTLKPRVDILEVRRVPVLNPDSWRSDKRGANARGYTYRWQQRRAAHLRAHPLCSFCAERGRVTAATVADHITPHRGDPVLFDGPLQSLCKPCHDAVKSKVEGRGG